MQASFGSRDKITTGHTAEQAGGSVNLLEYGPHHDTYHDAKAESASDSLLGQRKADPQLHKTIRSVRISLYVSMALLMVSAILEMAFASATVQWLISITAEQRQYPISFYHNDDIISYLPAVPMRLDTIPGHVSNAIGGTNLVLVGFLGIIALVLRSRKTFQTSRLSKTWYHIWILLLTISALFTSVGLIYVYTSITAYTDPSIDGSGLISSDDQYRPYPYDNWTLLSWFSAVANSRFRNASDENDVVRHLQLIKGWIFNIIPLFLLCWTVLGLRIADGMLTRRQAHHAAT